MILIRAHFYNHQYDKADKYFSKALAVLEHHWGPFHPFQITIYGVMANLLISIKRMNDAMFLYQSSLKCCLQVLGSNHNMTAEVHTDLGKLQVRMGGQSDALKHFKQSYLIYESYLGQDALETAKSALQVACI